MVVTRLRAASMASGAGASARTAGADNNRRHATNKRRRTMISSGQQSRNASRSQFPQSAALRLAGPSAHFPKFVSYLGTHPHELRKVMGTSKPMVLVPLFYLTFLNRICGL